MLKSLFPQAGKTKRGSFTAAPSVCRKVEKPAALAGRGGLWLQVGDQQVHIGTEAGVDRMATKAHLAYEVTNLAHWRQALEALGLEVLESVPIPGVDRFEFRDPFGSRVEFIEKLGEEAR